MSHNHNHDHHNHFHRHSGSLTNIRWAFLLNLFFTIIEFVGGLLTNSVAILTDAIHDLGDTFSIGMSWYLEKYSKKERTTSFSYGYTRFSLLAALINVNILLVGSVLMLIKSIDRFMSPQVVHAEGMFLLSLLGITINGIAALKMKKGHTVNERVLMLHLLEDVLGWIAIFIGSIIMYFKEIPILDPILSISIALYIIYGAIKNLKKTLGVFLQGVPENLSIETIKEKIQEVKNVIEVHDIHIWSLDGDYNVLSVHIVINDNLPRELIIQVKSNVHKKLMELNIPHATLEIEFNSEKCHLENH